MEKVRSTRVKVSLREENLMSEQLDSVGLILKALTEVLELELIKKQKEESNTYDGMVKQLKGIVDLAKKSY